MIEDVSPNYFLTLGVRPLLGTTILPGSAAAARSDGIVLSYKMWQQQFGGDLHIVGKQLISRTLQDLAVPGPVYTVLGVMPPSFHSAQYYGEDFQGWVPLVLTNQEKAWHGGGDALIVARLKDGVSLAQANAALRVYTAALATKEAELRNSAFHARTLLDQRTEFARQILLLLFGAVGLVLLIACANLSSLALARGSGRSHEVAIRGALGASRRRLIRQFLVESSLLAFCGGAVGLLAGIWGARLLRLMAPPDTPRLSEVHFHLAVFWYALGITCVSVILFGLFPAVRASGHDLETALKRPSASSSLAPRGSGSWGSFLVIAEVAVSVVLLTGSALVLRSLDKLLTLPLGFRSSNLWTMSLDPSHNDKSLAPEIVAQIKSLPGIESAALDSSRPLRGGISFEGFLPEPAAGASPGVQPSAGLASVTPGYFSTADITLLEGRDFSAADNSTAPPVAIVNQSLASLYFSGAALGKRLALGEQRNGKTVETQIIGVARDSCDFGTSACTRPEIYQPFAQASGWGGTLLFRTAAPASLIFPEIRRVISSVDKNADLGEPLTIAQIVSEIATAPRFRAILLGSFGVLGLILVLIGIYGVIAYSVSHRTREIGIRIALGAQRGDVLRLIVGRGAVLVLIGIALGLGAAFGLTRFLRGLLFGVTPTDPTTFAGVAILLLLTALAACYIPARRAMRVDPAGALRCE